MAEASAVQISIEFGHVDGPESFDRLLNALCGYARKCQQSHPHVIRATTTDEYVERLKQFFGATTISTSTAENEVFVDLSASSVLQQEFCKETPGLINGLVRKATSLWRSPMAQRYATPMTRSCTVNFGHSSKPVRILVPDAMIEEKQLSEDLTFQASELLGSTAGPECMFPGYHGPRKAQEGTPWSRDEFAEVGKVAWLALFARLCGRAYNRAAPILYHRSTDRQKSVATLPSGMLVDADGLNLDVQWVKSSGSGHQLCVPVRSEKDLYLMKVDPFGRTQPHFTRVKEPDKKRRYMELMCGAAKVTIQVERHRMNVKVHLHGKEASGTWERDVEESITSAAASVVTTDAMIGVVWKSGRLSLFKLSMINVDHRLTPLNHYIQAGVLRLIAVHDIPTRLPMLIALTDDRMLVVLHPWAGRLLNVLVPCAPNTVPIAAFEHVNGVRVLECVLNDGDETQQQQLVTTTYRYTQIGGEYITYTLRGRELASKFLLFSCVWTPPCMNWARGVTGLVGSHCLGVQMKHCLCSVIWIVNLAQTITQETVDNQPIPLHRAIEAIAIRLAETDRTARVQVIACVDTGTGGARQKKCDPYARLQSYFEHDARRKVYGVQWIHGSNAPAAAGIALPEIGAIKAANVCVVVCQGAAEFHRQISGYANPSGDWATRLGSQCGVRYSNNLPPLAWVENSHASILNTDFADVVLAVTKDADGVLTFACANYPNAQTVRDGRGMVGVYLGDYEPDCAQAEPLLGVLGLGDLLCWARLVSERDIALDDPAGDARPFVRRQKAGLVQRITQHRGIALSGDIELAALRHMLALQKKDRRFLITTNRKG